jgi:hypothetical protein
LRWRTPQLTANQDLLLAQGGAGFVVPTGYSFHPLCLSASSNADLTAGTATFKVTDNGTELVGSVDVELSDTVQKAADVIRVGVEPIAAGHVVGVSVTCTAAYLPVTADVDAILVGVLLPA